MTPGIARACELAYFIHCDEEVALRVVTRALARLREVAARQEKRIYYRPKTRRSKVSVSPVQLLQTLVYHEAEANERRLEAAAERGGAPPSEADLIVRFVKHLVRITTARNAFHVNLGLSRILYGYSTREAMAIYDLVSQDPACPATDDYYRARTRILLREVGERFVSLAETRRAARGERRLPGRRASAGEAALVGECLDHFTPWDTHCVLPETFGPRRLELAALRSPADDPDGEHEVEVRRMHTLIHPACYSRLTAALGLDPPSERLSLPRFAPADRRPICAAPWAVDRRLPAAHRLDGAAAVLLLDLARLCGLDASV